LVTVKDLLSDHRTMDSFIHDLEHYSITNCSGHAYCKIRLCHYADGILLRSDHHTSCSCDISIATIPTATVICGCQDSRSYGNANPSLTEGVFVCVWSSGTWQKDGPWREVIEKHLEKLIQQLETVKEAKKKSEEEERAKRAAHAAEANQRLCDAWEQKANVKEYGDEGLDGVRP